MGSASSFSMTSTFGDQSDTTALFSAADRNLGLPAHRKLTSECWEATGYASHYGGLDELTRYAGMNKNLPLRFEATWTHGIIEPWRYQRYPFQLLFGVRHDPHRLILVVDNEQKNRLTKLGYDNVHAIGSPYIYAKPRFLPRRITGSVLLMPPHTLDGAPFTDETKMQAYCDYAACKYRDAGLTVYASIHSSCIKNRLWWPIFLRNKIPVVAGADHSDANSLRRIWHLFSQFETVSSPASGVSIGSHVYYALAAGCKVVLEGPGIGYTNEQMLHDLSYRREIARGEDSSNDLDLIRATQEFARQFERPASDQSLGNAMVGLHHKRSPSEIRSLLGWSRCKQITKQASLISSQLYFRAAMLAKKTGIKRPYPK